MAQDSLIEWTDATWPREILAPFLKDDPDAFIFSPSEAEASRRAKMSESRRTPSGWGNEPGSKVVRRAKKKPGAHYTTMSFAKAIAHACAKAFPPPDHLNRIKVAGTSRKRVPRFETREEWKVRLGPDGWAELIDWRKRNSWHPHRQAVRERFCAPDLLVLDEVQVRSSNREWEDNELTTLIDRRWRDQKATILISNLKADELRANLGGSIWGRLFESGGPPIEVGWDRIEVVLERLKLKNTAKDAPVNPQQEPTAEK